MSDTTTPAAQGTFGRLFSDLFSSATTVLTDIGKVRAEGYVQNLEAQNYKRIQQTLGQQAASGTNDPAGAERAALENTVNVLGFLSVPKANAPFYYIGLALVGVLLVVLLFRTLRK